MMTTLYLHGYHHFLPPNVDDKTLRQQLKQYGIDARRMARFTQLALLGALPLKAKIDTQTAIYLASPYSSPSKFNAAFGMLHQQNMPSPLDFMANTHNAAVFHLAQWLATQGETLFLSMDGGQQSQLIFLAKQALHAYPERQVLVGWALEASAMGQQEGSCYWLLSGKQSGALATVECAVAMARQGGDDDFLRPFRKYERDILLNNQIIF